MMPLRKELGLIELVVIGIAGAVGTGVLFSSAGMAAVAGPGVVLGWILGSIFYFFVSLTYVELSLTYPEAGGPSRYALYSHGRVTNFINAMADLIWYLFIPPIEALAVVEGLDFFYPGLINQQTGVPTLQGVILGVILLLLFVPFNYFGVKVFGRSTLAFGIIKLIMYVAVAIGVVFVSFNVSNFTSYGFLPFGIAGVFSAVPLAMFAFGGIRVLPDYAEETKDPDKLKEGIILTVLGQSLIYVLFAVAFVGAINWSGLGIKEGDWSALSSLPGNPFIDIASSYHANALLLLTVIIGILGPFVTGYIYLGAGTRVLFAMGRSGYVPKVMEDLHHKYAIPSWALLVFAIVGAIVTYISSPLPTIYGLITDSVVAGYLGFSVNPVAMMVLRKQGISRKIIPGGAIIAGIAFASASLIVFWSGWPLVPYAVLLLTIGSVIFGVIYKIKENFTNSLWYIVYIAFLTLMSYIGSDGALNLINFYLASAIVAIVSVAVFYPWGVISGMKEVRTKQN